MGSPLNPASYKRVTANRIWRASWMCCVELGEQCEEGWTKRWDTALYLLGWARVCTCLCLWTRTCVCVYARAYMRACMYTCLRTGACVSFRARTCLSTHACGYFLAYLPLRYIPVYTGAQSNNRGFSRRSCWRAETMKQFCVKIDLISQRREMYCFCPPTWRQWRHMKMLYLTFTQLPLTYNYLPAYIPTL